MEPDALANDILRRQQSMAGIRGNWEGHWEEIAGRVMPAYRNTFTNNGFTSPGQQKTDLMIDATAALALPKFAAAMESMLTPRGSTWHRLGATDQTLNKNRLVRQYFDDVTDLLFRYRYAPRANFASQQHEIYMGLGAFGTGIKYIDRLRGYEKGLRYRTIHLGECYILENHQGIIDTVFRRFQMTARQVMQRFKDTTKIPDAIVTAASDSVKCETPFWFINAVYPRSDEDNYDPRRLDAKGMRYADVYVSETGRQTVEEMGFNVFPYAISRYVTAPGEVYGRSPAMTALPAIKTLNEMKRTVLTQGHRVTNPVLLVHDDGVADGFSLKPGAINTGAMTADGKRLVDVLPTGNLALAKELIEREASTVDGAFLVDLFLLNVENPQMTATEVIERTREKGALLSPTMGRQQTEDLGPTIERELDVLSAQGLLPPMPLILQQAKGEYRVVYDSPLSRAQRAENASGFMRLVDWAKEYYAASQDPRPFDWLNWDQAMPELADIAAVPARWINAQQQVDALRQQRTQAQQAQQAVEAAPALASIAGKAPASIGGLPAGA